MLVNSSLNQPETMFTDTRLEMSVRILDFLITLTRCCIDRY